MNLLLYFTKCRRKNESKKDTLAKKEVAEKRGTWIDWEHLKSCGKLLARCRYTLKYTYPKAYMMPTGKEKDLFEYQQGLSVKNKGSLIN